MKKKSLFLIFLLAAICFMSFDEAKRDITTLSNEELGELLESATEYGYDKRFLSDYDFILYDNGSMIPTPVKMRHEVEKDGYEREFVVGQMPIGERKINTKYVDEKEGRDDLVNVVEQLSARRSDINFETFYKKFGWIVRQVVPKSIYKERYAPTVDMLLLVYADLSTHEKLYGVIEKVMKQHWQDALEEPYIGLPNYYSQLKPHLNSNVIKRLETFYSPSNTSYQNDYMIIWSYSFWLRRKTEGKTDEVYKTLCAIRDDFK